MNTFNKGAEDYFDVSISSWMYGDSKSFVDEFGEDFRSAVEESLEDE